MSSGYNSQPWNQNQLNFGPLQLEQEFDFGDRQQQHQPQQPQVQPQQQHLQQNYGSPDPYAYQQPLPSSTNPNQQSSSLHGAFGLAPNHQQSHSRNTSFGSTNAQQARGADLARTVYSSPQAQGQVPAPYRANFNFSTAPAQMQGIDSGRTPSLNSSFLSPSHRTLHETFPKPSAPNTHQSYNIPADDTASFPQHKRLRDDAFKDENNLEDPDSEPGPSGEKDGKSKLYVVLCRLYYVKLTVR